MHCSGVDSKVNFRTRANSTLCTFLHRLANPVQERGQCPGGGGGRSHLGDSLLLLLNSIRMMLSLQKKPFPEKKVSNKTGDHRPSEKERKKFSFINFVWPGQWPLLVDFGSDNKTRRGPTMSFKNLAPMIFSFFWFGLYKNLLFIQDLWICEWARQGWGLGHPAI